MTNRELARRWRSLAADEDSAISSDCTQPAAPVTLEKGVTKRWGRYWVTNGKAFLGEYKYLEHANEVARTGKPNLEWRMLQ